MKNKKVLFIAHCTSLYGANRSLLGLIDGLQTLGVESSVACPEEKGPFVEELLKRKINYKIMPIKYWMHPAKKGRFPRLFNNLSAGVKIAIWARREKFDVIYTNSSATPAGAFASVLSFKPHVWHIREYGEPEYDLRLDWGRKIFGFWLERADAVISISHDIQSVVLAGFKLKCSQIIYNGVFSRNELKTIGTELKPYQPKKDFTFIIIGQINSNKNQAEAVKAFEMIMNKYPETKLWILGDYRMPAGALLKKTCDSKNYGERIVFFDFVREPMKLLTQADCLLMCSKYEGFGRVTVEAMACGKPVIGFDSSGTKEIILDQKTGLLYQGPAPELAQCMEQLINNQKFAHELGQEGIKRVEKKFMLEDYAKNISEVLKTI